jgi:Coenzyme PQQ synthesis protein D (PqqD)
MSSTPARFRSSPDALATRVGDEIVLVDLKTDKIYSLNRTAARIWELMCADCDRAEVERRMLEEFDVARGELAEAIDELVTSMTQDGLLARSA